MDTDIGSGTTTDTNTHRGQGHGHGHGHRPTQTQTWIWTQPHFPKHEMTKINTIKSNKNAVEQVLSSIPGSHCVGYNITYPMFIKPTITWVHMG